MWSDKRNSGDAFNPGQVRTEAFPWLIVPVGNRNIKDRIDNILTNAISNDNIDNNSIPTPDYESPLDIIPQIDDLGETDADIIARFYKYVFAPIQDIHYNMPQGTKVAVVFDKRDFMNGSIFRKLVRYMPKLFTPICSTTDFSWQTKGCKNKSCQEQTESCECSHNCLYKLSCMLLSKRELPENLFI